MIGNNFASMFYLLVASLLFVTVSSVATGATATKTEEDLVSVIIASLEGRSEVGIITEYLEMSRDALTKELPLENSGRKLSYTFFAPTDFSLFRRMVQDTVNPLTADGAFRNKILLRHFARQRVSSDDLSKLDKLIMADAKEATLSRIADTKINRINNEEILPGAIQLANNLGIVHVVDGVFMTHDEMSEAIYAYNAKNPNTGYGHLVGSASPPES
ncbi:hypothetical protein DAPPUDRAFT_232528 [Daphnia pulex]|uniref:FAS1 domain-containing protein n=1 Tax=Daphnia pulex TaxID=6669 RepID=E9FR47_DAPPU|nr:hypothetical protein DAPPUDRAFT_232528 [Daphnia pulex]|eukprot:EFX90097.1 hypothetical protein DAPPUDRAFT_232528 [Daphnia pulex]